MTRCERPQSSSWRSGSAGGTSSRRSRSRAGGCAGGADSGGMSSAPACGSYPSSGLSRDRPWRLVGVRGSATLERQLGDLRLHAVHQHSVAGGRLAPNQGQGDRPEPR